jgi:hypothetical protein
MKITKGEAIALNLWGMIKEVKEIDETDRATIIATLNRLNGHPCSFTQEFLEDPKIYDCYEIELNQWEFLRLIRLYNESNNDMRLFK